MLKFNSQTDSHVILRARGLQAEDIITIEWVAVGNGSVKSEFEVTQTQVSLNGNFKFVSLRRLDTGEQYTLNVGTSAGAAGDAIQLLDNQSTRADDHILSVR